MTILGGVVALHVPDRLHLILGYSAGAIIGVAFFDLIPEAINVASLQHPASVLAIVAVGFGIYMVLDRTVAPHDLAKTRRPEPHWRRGMLAAGSLCIHSFVDGFAIGIAFKVSASAGAVVSAAILAHDFSDGVNVVAAILGRNGKKRIALHWLFLNAVAPVLGAASTRLTDFGSDALGVCLALLGGFFIYISASDLLPESYHDHRTIWTTIMTIFGALTVYVAIWAAKL
jgi:zinc transporter ZupT